MSLEIFAMHFLRFEKACSVAMFERSPRWGIGNPDVLGITKAGFLLEIEIKRSMSDFRANAKKHHMWARHKPDVNVEHQANMEKKWPKQFWFLVPPELVRKAEAELPDFAGLMRGPGRSETQQVYVVRKAPVNAKSERLSVKEMLAVGHCMANQILCQAHRIETLQNKTQYDPCYEPYWYPSI